MSEKMLSTNDKGMLAYRFQRMESLTFEQQAAIEELSREMAAVGRMRFWLLVGWGVTVLGCLALMLAIVWRVDGKIAAAIATERATAEKAAAEKSAGVETVLDVPIIRTHTVFLQDLDGRGVGVLGILPDNLGLPAERGFVFYQNRPFNSPMAGCLLSCNTDGAGIILFGDADGEEVSMAGLVAGLDESSLHLQSSGGRKQKIVVAGKSLPTE